MGSLSPQSPSSSSLQPSNYCIYASFCYRDASPNTNLSNWIQCYTPSINTWHYVSRIPGLIKNHVLKGFSMVVVADSIYIIGGRLCRKLSGHTQDEEDLEVTSSVLRYNVCANEWQKCASLGIPRFDFACAVKDNKIYVAGGRCDLACPRGISSAEVYDPALDEWKALPSMKTLRYKCAGVTLQGKIHIVGGFAFTEQGDSDNEGTFHTLERCSAEVYDCERDTWNLMLGMWQLDVPPNQIVVVNGKLFSCGDCLNAWKGHIEAYDDKLNMWNEVDGSHLQTLSSPISTSDATGDNWSPIQRLYLTMAPIEAQLYFLVGYRMPGEIPRSLSIVHVFDTSKNEYGWRSFEPMDEEGEKELCSHCCVIVQT